MTHRIHLDTTVPESRTIEVVLPADVPVGLANITVVVTPKEHKLSSGLDIVESPIFGMWADRNDIEDSAAYAKDLRDRAWKRKAS